MQYLEEAAVLLRKAAEMNENKTGGSGFPRGDREIAAGRERIAMKFAQLAAIEKGLIPAEMVADLLARVVASINPAACPSD